MGGEGLPLNFKPGFTITSFKYVINVFIETLIELLLKVAPFIFEGLHITIPGKVFGHLGALDLFPTFATFIWKFSITQQLLSMFNRVDNNI